MSSRTAKLVIKYFSMTDKPNDINELYEFGQFSVDKASRTLKRDGELIALAPRVFDTLFLLVTRHGQVLTKREMLDSVWQDAFVEEGNLTQNIYTLRKTLGKQPDGREWIETLPRKGYIFSGEVKTADLKAVSSPQSSDVKRSRFKTARLGLALALLLVLAVAAYFGTRAIRNIRDVSAATADVAFQKLTFSGRAEFPTISPDGKSFAYTTNGRLFIQAVGSDTARAIILLEKTEAGFLQFTSDGKRIAFRDQTRFFISGNVRAISLTDGKPETIAENVWGGFSFSPDGKQMAFVRDAPDENKHFLIVREIATGTERKLAELVSPSRFILVGSPAWSPEGKRIAIATAKQEAQSPRSQLSIYDVANGTVEEFAPQQIKQFEQAVWRPDGKNIAVIARENQKFFQIWQLSYPQGKLSRITNDLNIYRSLSMSSDGSKILSANFVTFSHVWTAPADDLKTQRQMTFGNLNRDGTIGMQWTPDGNLIYTSRIFGNVDLWRVGPTELERAQLTHDAGDVNAYPQLTADGALYFTSTRTGNTQVWKMNADGSEQMQITFGEKEVNEFPQVSPDGKYVFYVKKSKGETSVWRISLAEKINAALEIDGKLSPENFLAISPDGKYLATRNIVGKTADAPDPQKFQIAIISTIQKEKPRFFELPSEWLTWSSEPDAFDYVENRDGTAYIWRQRLDGTPPQLLLEMKDDHIAAITWSPDGKQLAISKGKRLNDAVLISNF